ncbi:hypothetical protein [Synechococcus sp. CCY9202]|uniref:hypothetical protein n=1 Tax=Synechococcus sp. CCY9202 TaxID=174698 RepID=UPI002B214577|nr:hypothetical protein [Synechococcus sp. CCY9202]MEA5424179.1 hypothetical protein [Synechococcus sp. CCY9202]
MPPLRRSLLMAVLILGSFQVGRLSERAVWPCRLRPVSAIVAPLVGQSVPSPQLCELLLQIPQF